MDAAHAVSVTWHLFLFVSLKPMSGEVCPMRTPALMPGDVAAVIT
jgi:hypothetical protein